MTAPLNFTKLTNHKGLLTKTYALDGHGTLHKTTTANLYDGRAEAVACDDLEGFLILRAGLKPNEALTYGITGKASVGITTQRDLRDKPAPSGDRVARDSDAFHFAHAPGVLMLDHDAEHMPTSYHRDSLRAALLEAVPELALAPMAWTTSASSHIINAETGEELQGLRGQRLYIPVLDATDVPRVGRVIYERLWAAGIGTFIVSKSGALLDRNLVDASAWQAERIDFAAGAECVPPLEQRPAPWYIWEADLIGGTSPWDSREGLADLSAEHKEAAAQHRSTARARVADEAATVRVGYIEERALALVESGTDIEEARRLVREAVGHSLLFAE